MTDELDLSALRNLKNIIGGDVKDLAELVSDFVTVLPNQLQQMRDHASIGDLTALRIATHSCKSNARDLGALHLSQLCARLESESAAGEVTELSEQMSDISKAVEIALSKFAKLDLADV